MSYEVIKGDLIDLAKRGRFDVIAHGCNCFCRQKSGIAKQMAENFQTANSGIYSLESGFQFGEYNKLGLIEEAKRYIDNPNFIGYIEVVNMYTQYRYGTDKKHLDETALRLCLRKLNHMYKGKRVGLPQIGCGLAGGKWEEVEPIIKEELKDMDVTIVIFEK